uniref:Serpentine receptor class gamma n=2 Tax=Caenorhabditis tropicalis TaxID=1561998 RepID=A0A1I7U6S9_9PELO
MCTLFFLSVERCYATFLIRDYETNLRKPISVLLNLFLSLFGVGSCFVITNRGNTVYLIVFLLVINGFALLLHFLLQWWNRKIYSALHENMFMTSYSLAQRFQVAENIKSLKMLNNIIFYMGFMNVIVVFSVLFSSFDLDSTMELIITICLDISIFIYSFCYPVIMYHSCERWKTEIIAFFTRIGLLKPSSVLKVHPILNTFGKSMEQANTMRNHFDNLQLSWEAVPRKSIISLISQ